MIQRIVLSTISILLFFVAGRAHAGGAEKPCEMQDLIGTWELITAKYAGQVPDDYHDLLQPYQIRVYKNDRGFQQLSANKKLSKDQLATLLSASQKQTYQVEEHGIIATLNDQGKILERYSCSYFIQDAPKIHIEKGTLSLLWMRQGKPLILNTYKRIK